MDKKNKSRRGRKSGSVSFAAVKMSDLKEMFGDKAQVVVSLRWAKNLGLEYKAINGGTTTIGLSADAEKPLEIKITEDND